MDQSEEANLRQQLEQLREKLLEREREEAEFRDPIVEPASSLGRVLARAMIKWLEGRGGQLKSTLARRRLAGKA